MGFPLDFHGFHHFHGIFLGFSLGISLGISHGFFGPQKDLKLTVHGEMDIAYRGEIRTPSRCGRMDQCVAFGRTVPRRGHFWGQRAARFKGKSMGKPWEIPGEDGETMGKKGETMG